MKEIVMYTKDEYTAMAALLHDSLICLEAVKENASKLLAVSKLEDLNKILLGMVMDEEES